MPDAEVIDRPATGEAVPETAAKGEFAALCGVTAGRVSQWLSEGKISAASLQGEGRSARIVVRAAVAELAQKLDVSQSVGLNGLASRLAITGLAAGGQPAAEPRPEPSAVTDRGEDGSGADLFEDGLRSDPPRLTDDTTAAIARQRLRQQELTTAKLEREEALAAGRYVLADDARAQIGRTASTALNAVEAGLNGMADDLCARFPDLPRRDVVHALMQSFRKVRERAAHGFAEKRAAAEAAAEADAGSGEGE